MPEREGISLRLNPAEFEVVDHSVFVKLGRNLADCFHQAISETAIQQTPYDASGMMSGFLRRLVELYPNELGTYLEDSGLKELAKQNEGESYA